MKVTVCTSRQILSPCGLNGFDHQIDTYVGCEHLCYYCYALAHAETDWSAQIQIYENIVDQLRAEIDRIPPQTIYMGYRTDPYQPCEAHYHQTRKALALLLQKGFSASILTKSDLVLRDLNLFKQMDNASVSVSVAFNDNAARGLFEAKTMDTEKRIEALRQIKAAGLRTGALVCPVIPYITDAPQLIDRLAPYADKIWIYPLRFNDRSGQHWLNIQKILNTQFPQLVKRIEPALFSQDHMYWTQLRENLTALKSERQLELSIHV